MIKRFGNRVTRVIPVLVLAAFLGGAACEKPAVGTMGETVSGGGVAFNVTDYELRYLELSEEDKTLSYAEPVLALKIKLTNEAEEALVYSPSHRTQQMTEASTPLLYRDPGPEAELPPASKETVSGVYLDKGRLPEQVVAPQTLQAGESVEDVFLFELPQNEQASLILSLPPAMTHGDLPVLVRIPYEYKEPKGPAVFEAGEAIEVGAASFEVQSAEVAYIKTTHSIEGEGYSSDPWLKVTYKIENKGEAPLRYTPEHDVEGGRGAAIYAGNSTAKRVKLPPNTRAEGRVNSTTSIEPGDSITDFELFERPDTDADSLTFEYPANRMGASGLIRVSLPFADETPPLPEEMKEPTKADKSDD